MMERMQTYFSLTKPGIICGNALTGAAGFLLASKGHIDPLLFMATLVGLSLIIASACVLNNYIDRRADAKMSRTMHRALAQEILAPQRALVFAAALGMLGAAVLFFFSHAMAAAIALFGFFVYVVLYSFSKYHTMHATSIGSIAGAVPPVVGYCAVSECMTIEALLLFALVVLWQMPHFFSIALYRMNDYAAASIPVLPIQKSPHMAKVHMVLYIVAFLAVSFTLCALQYLGVLYFCVSSVLGLAWLLLSIKGLTCSDDKKWARIMFFFSLAVIVGICVAIPFSVKN